MLLSRGFIGHADRNSVVVVVFPPTPPELVLPWFFAAAAAAAAAVRSCLTRSTAGCAISRNTFVKLIVVLLPELQRTVKAVYFPSDSASTNRLKHVFRLSVQT
jgi:hypothetical protein